MMHAASSRTLASFQDAFARALLATGAPPAEMTPLFSQPGFAVYRNTVMKGCIDALHANFPAVARLVGDEWFRAAAAVYARETLPVHPVLFDYGATFPDFLERFEPAAELPYLAGVARLDRYWTEAHTAADAEALDQAAIAGIPPEVLAAARLQPHPSARWAWFANSPIFTIWSRNRLEAPPDTEFDWRAEGALLARPRDAVEWSTLDAAAHAFIGVCAAGGTVADAAAAARGAEPVADIARLLAGLIDAGAFACGQGFPPTEHSHE